MTGVCRKPLGLLQPCAYGRATSRNFGRRRAHWRAPGPQSEVTVSEEDRSRLYAWFREHTDEPLAEYLMSCLAPAPLSDLATKTDLAGIDKPFEQVDQRFEQIDKRFERVDQRFDALFALREADRIEAATLRERDRAERKSDLRSVKAHHYTVIGFIVALFVANLTIL